MGQGDNKSIDDDETPITNNNANLGDNLFREIATGYRHTYALNNAGAIMCWGTSDDGALGNGDVTTIGTDTPPPLLSMSDTTVSLIVNSKHSCALLDNTSMHCWDRELELDIDNSDQIDGDEHQNTMNPIPMDKPMAQLTTRTLHTYTLNTIGNVRC